MFLSLSLSHFGVVFLCERGKRKEKGKEVHVLGVVPLFRVWRGSVKSVKDYKSMRGWVESVSEEESMSMATERKGSQAQDIGLSTYRLSTHRHHWKANVRWTLPAGPSFPWCMSGPPR